MSDGATAVSAGAVAGVVACPASVGFENELLYDLTIVVAFGTAANELAHAVAAGHYVAGTAGFAVAAFAVSWAWLNYSWFASAYDADDWVFRLATMVQMVGVIVLSLGL